MILRAIIIPENDATYFKFLNIACRYVPLKIYCNGQNAPSLWLAPE
jgi:hypothetical protein